MKHKIKVNTSKGGNAFVIGFAVILPSILLLAYIQSIGFGSKVFLDILVIFALVLFFVAMGALLIFMNRVAVFDSEGVTIKSVLKVLGTFKWSDVVAATISEKERKNPTDGTVTVSRTIEITTDGVVHEDLKLKSPYTMIYSPENQKIVLMYLEKYCPSVDASAFRKVSETKTTKK